MKALLLFIALVLLAACQSEPSQFIKADFGITAILSALIAAGAAAASGIAGAEGQRVASEDNAKNSAANRAQQLKITKMQIAAQQEQQAKDQAMAAQQQLASVYGNKADTAYALAQRQMGANGDAMDAITRAYAKRGR